MTKSEFAICMAVVEAGLGAPLSAPTLDVWYRALGDLPREALEAAVTRVLCERTYPGMPPPGLLRKHAIEFLHGTPASPEAAYRRVRLAMSRFGMPINEDEGKKLEAYLGQTIWSVILGIGGWQRLCDAKESERGTFFAQFRDAWTRACERETTQKVLPAHARPKVNVDPRAVEVGRRLTADVPKLESK